jgi:hypothetical protein
MGFRVAALVVSAVWVVVLVVIVVSSVSRLPYKFILTDRG